MQTASQMLAKSLNYGGTTLIEHTTHVIAAIGKFASYLGMDKHIAQNGAILHDIGKCHPEFQEKLIENPPYDIVKATMEIPLRHELSSLLFLPMFPAEQRGPLTDMIIAHHKSTRNPQLKGKGYGILDLYEYYDPDELAEKHTGDWEWAKPATEILNHFGITGAPPDEDKAEETIKWLIEYCEKKGKGFNQWRGLLMLADHFASALGEKTEQYLDELFNEPDLSFFTSENRRSSLFPLSLKPTDDPRPHTLVTAPTGSGKTDFLLKRCRKRVFYVLPFQASINAMFDRLKEACEYDNVQILHAASRLKIETTEEGDVESEIALQSLGGAAIKVLTPHQLGGICFGTRGYEALALDLKGQDIILDEIHSYNEETQALVLGLIKGLLLLECRIHIGTATMPKILKGKIHEIIGGDAKVCETRLEEDELATYTRHKVHKLVNRETADEIIAASLDRQEKILLVANRVTNAQHWYSVLKSKHSDIPMLLLHSRFKRGDRAALEQKLMQEFDKTDGPCIVVSTQVVEVSLDISFDVMITECAPIDSLIQRFGRINRRRTAETIGKTKPVYVLKPADNAKEVKPYKLETIVATWNALPDDMEVKETEWQQMIDTVYTSLDIAPLESVMIIKNGGFNLRMLTHYPKGTMLDALQINAGTSIIASDEPAYLKGNFANRLSAEIPIPWYTLKRYAEKFHQLNAGTDPAVIPDDYYSSELGLQENQDKN